MLYVIFTNLLSTEREEKRDQAPDCVHNTCVKVVHMKYVFIVSAGLPLNHVPDLVPLVVIIQLRFQLSQNVLQ